MIFPRPLTVALAVALTVSAPWVALAHVGPQQMVLASTAPGGGQLALRFDFSTIARLSYSSTLGDIDVYAAIVPSFQEIASDSPGDSLYRLTAGTQVSMEIIALGDAATAVQLGAALLDAPGDSAVVGASPIADTHPQWQLLLSGDNTGEGSVSFRVVPTTAGSYTASPVYTLRLATGPARPFVLDSSAYDQAAITCAKSLAKLDAKLMAKTVSTLSRCMLAIADLQAREALAVTPTNLDAVRSAAEATCAGLPGTAVEWTPLGRVAALEAAAATSMQQHCGGLVDERTAADHAKSVRCRAEASLAYAFPRAHFGLQQFLAQAEQGGDPLSDHFPCLVAVIGD